MTPRSWSIGSFTPQFRDRLVIIFCVKDGGAGDEDVSAVLDRQARGRGVDAAINFDVNLCWARFIPLGRAFHFSHHLGAERLTAETGMDGHDEQEVDPVEEGLDRLKRRCGIQRQTGATTSVANFLQSSFDMMFRFRLDVDCDGVCAGFDKSRRVMIGMLDHQVDIERKLGLLAHKIDNRRPEGNIIDEMSVHDVAMDPISAGFFGGADFIGQAGKIGSENGGRDDDFLRGHVANVKRSRFNVQYSRGPSFPLTARGSVSCYGVSAGQIAVARTVAATVEGMDALLADWNQGDESKN